MRTVLFSPTMSTDDFSAGLARAYYDLDENCADAFKNSMKNQPRNAEGKPISKSNLVIYQRIDEHHQNGKNITAAIRLTLEEHPSSINDKKDIEDKIETVTREYRRYRKTRDAGLDPSRTYDDRSLAEFILSKQFALAAAIFEVADKKRRARICDKLNGWNAHRATE